MIALNRVLVPSDFSETSEAAVTYGIAIARAFHAKLFLLHVAIRHDFDLIVERQRSLERTLSAIEPGPHDAPAEIPLEVAIQHAGRELFGKTVTEHDEQELGIEYVLRVSGLGGTYVEIVRFATEREIDLIVMGTHGRGFMAHMLMGGVADKVVQRAPCPVLTVRHPEHEFVIPDPGAGRG